MSEPSTIRTVSRFESQLLRIARYIVKQLPVDQAQRLLLEKIERPPCLSADCLHLLKDTLRKGMILYLVRAGGWKRDRFLRDGVGKFGRLWERIPVERLTLSFGKPTLELLLWLTAAKVKEEKPFWRSEITRQSVGDQLFVFLTYEAMKQNDHETGASMRTSNVCMENALIRLAYAGDFASGNRLPVPSFDIWLREPGIYILEALQPFLEQRWLTVEREKSKIVDWNEMNQQGIAQGDVLNAYLEGVEKANRRDLGRFLVQVLSRIFRTNDVTPPFWVGGLQGAGPARLSERIDTHRNALSVVRQVNRLRGWQNSARTSSYMDEDYSLNQFWLSEWDRFDLNTVAERAERVLQQVEPLRMM